jgi:hypothetical protein
MIAALGVGNALAYRSDPKEGTRAAKKILNVCNGSKFLSYKIYYNETMFQAFEDGASTSIDSLSLEGTIPENRPDGRIEFRSVNFTYPTRPEQEVAVYSS